MSGGIFWIPNNPLMRAEGVPDSYEDAMAHFEAVVGDVGPCSSFERRHAFLTAGPEMTTFLQRLGVRLVTCPGYSDYYSNLKGGHDVGRGIEPVPWDGRALGPWLPKLQPGLAQSLGLAVMTNEARSLSNYNRSLRSFAISARVALRTAAAKVRRQALLTNGASLIGQLLADRRRPRHPGVDRGAARGPDRGGRPRRRRAHACATARPCTCGPGRACCISAGGFAHNREMRQRYGGDQPNEGKWSMSNPGDTGEAIATAMRLGAQTALMDEAWWLPSPRPGRFGQSTLDQARQRPRTIYVDAGRAAVRERVELVHGGGQGDVRAGQDEPGRPLLADLRRPLPQALRPRAVAPRVLPEADVRERAAEEGADAGRARRAVRHRRRRARRDRRALQRARRQRASTPTTAAASPPTTGRWAIPTARCTPAWAPSTRRPTTPCEVLPGDIGTCGGLVTDEHARVLDEQDQPIEGLYATGNSTATVMGRHYLGPGASIANTMVFGYLAARHAAGAGEEHADG